MKRLQRLVLLLFMLVLATQACAEAPVLKPYGFFRLDVYVHDSPMNHPQSAMWALSETDTPASADIVAKDKGELNITPRLSRLGVDFAPMAVGDGFTLAGKVEIDFQNGGSESRPAMRMRHGYLKLTRGVWELLAGQTWDLASPLFPYVNHDAMMWNTGNTGDRRPQARFTLRPKLSKGKLRVAAAVAMPNAINNRDLDANGVRDGAFSMIPALQGLAEFEVSGVLVGVSGHFHRDRVVMAAASGPGFEDKDFDATMFAAHAKAALGDHIEVLGEFFTGENLDDIRGGIGQGINTTLGRSVATMGGWGEVRLQANERWAVAAGAAVDNPENGDLSDGMRTRNQAFYGAVRLVAFERLRVGLEYLHWQTDYVNVPDGDANRFNLWSVLTF